MRWRDSEDERKSDMGYRCGDISRRDTYIAARRERNHRDSSAVAAIPRNLYQTGVVGRISRDLDQKERPILSIAAWEIVRKSFACGNTRKEII